MKKGVFTIFIVLGFTLSAQDSISYPVYFATQRAEIDTTEEKRLKLLIRNFDSFQIEKIEINAYGDDRGGRTVNNPLSKERAFQIYSKIKSFLNKKSENVVFMASGKGFIPYDRAVEQAQRNRNRRGDIVVFYRINVEKTGDKTKKDKPPFQYDVKSFVDSAKDGDVCVLKVNFENQTHKMDTLASRELDSLASYLSRNNHKILISGHVYAMGVQQEIDVYDEETKTNELSLNRAKEVYTYLIKKGVKKNRLKYRGEGGRFPSGFGPKYDNRVEISILEFVKTKTKKLKIIPAEETAE